jgi:choline dehydrogenase-like flavoprotein
VTARSGPPDAPGADVVVVGGGLAGLELAHQLHERGAHVIVLEVGPGDERAHVNSQHAPDEALRRWLEPHRDPYFHQPWSSETPPHYTGSSGLRRRLGGRSLYWYGITLPMESWALRDPRWPAAVVAELEDGWNGGPGLYGRLADHLERWANAGPLAPEPRAPQVALGDRILRAAPRAVRPVGGGRWEAYSPLGYWGAGAAPTLCCETEVLEIVVRAGRAVGARARAVGSGRVREVPADAVVVGAGTIESSRLVLQARAAAGPLAPGRVTGLCDHLVQGVAVRVPAGTIAGEGPYVAPCPGARSNLFVSPEASGDGQVLDIRLIGEQLPSERSWVACAPRTSPPWPVRVHVELTEADREVLRAQRSILQEVWDALAAGGAVHPARLDFGDFDAPARTNGSLPEALAAVGEGVGVTWSSVLGTEDHESGTLPLGTVLDEHHEVVGVPGLFVVGPACFPRSGAANPSLTTLALAHRLAGVLAG